MTITTLSSRELNQDVTRAKKASRKGPVFITDRGKPAHVLLSFEDHQRLTKQHRNIAEALAMPEGVDIELQPPRLEITVRPADLTRCADRRNSARAWDDRRHAQCGGFQPDRGSRHQPLGLT